VWHFLAFGRGLWSGSVTIDLHAVWWSPQNYFGSTPCCGSGPVTFNANIVWSAQDNVLIDSAENPALAQSIVVQPQTFTETQLQNTICNTPRVATITVFEDASFTINNLP
jgi:hypothetical protein